MSVVRNAVRRGFYLDSVALMRTSVALEERAGVARAALMIGTPSNLSLLREAELLVAKEAGPNDLVIAVAAKGEASADAALEAAADLLDRREAGAPKSGRKPRSIAAAMGALPGANLALVSVPGTFAAAEARAALQRGLHAMIFSDNVPLADEVALKREAAERGLLVMGPDCGTAIIDGVPLGFANAVRRGSIGCVAASGTGLQQVTCLVDRLGGGISQAIGTGGRDLHAEVGGRSMLHGIAALAADPETKVIVLISKPPAPDVARRVLDAAQSCGKPVVVNFIGADAAPIRAAKLHPAATLEEAASVAVSLASGRTPAAMPELPANLPRPQKGRRRISGLYSGGTFAYEAELLLGKAGGHSIVDLGDDVFTRGRPHPMIDHRLRNQKIVEAAGEADVAVVLLDVVLGHGSHPDPAGEMAPALREARANGLVLVGFVCGTENDPQVLSRQEVRLRESGMLLAGSNAAAVRMAAAIAKGGGE